MRNKFITQISKIIIKEYTNLKINIFNIFKNSVNPYFHLLYML